MLATTKTNRWYSDLVSQEYGASLTSRPSAPTADQQHLERMKASLARLGMTQDLARDCASLREILAGRAPLPEDFKTIHDYLSSHIPMEYVVDTIACLQEYHPRFVPLLNLPTVRLFTLNDFIALSDFMKVATVRGGLNFNVDLSTEFNYEPTEIQMKHDPRVIGFIEEINQFREMLSRNTCRIKELDIGGYWGPTSPKWTAMAMAIKNSNSITVRCSPAWLPYIGPSTRHIILKYPADDKKTMSSLLAQGNIESVSCIAGSLNVIEGLLDAENHGSQVRNFRLDYQNDTPSDYETLQAKEIVEAMMLRSKLVTHCTVPSTQVLLAGNAMSKWLQTGPVHSINFDSSAGAYPFVAPIANQFLLRKGMLTAASLEGAAKGFVGAWLKIDVLPELDAHIVTTCLPTARPDALALVNKQCASASLDARRKLYEKWGGTRYSELGTPQITDVPPHAAATNAANDEKNDGTGMKRQRDQQNDGTDAKRRK
jgi:hypothetical protein